MEDFPIEISYSKKQVLAGFFRQDGKKARNVR